MKRSILVLLAVLLIMGRWGGAKAQTNGDEVDKLVDQLNNSSEWWPNRSSAAERLGKIADPRSREALIAMLKNKGEKEHFVRQAAIEALKNTKDERCINAIIAVLEDSDEFVRSAAIETLATTNDPRVFDLVIAALDDKHWIVQSSAVHAISWNLRDVRAVKPLIRFLANGDVLVKSEAAEALGRFKAREAVDSLMEALGYIEGTDGASWSVRAKAAAALGEIGDTKATNPLIGCLKDRRFEVRLNAAKALGKLRDRRAVEPLRAALPDWNVNQAIASALKELGWEPTSDAERVYLWICSKDGQSLKAQWEMTKRVLLADVKSHDRRNIENAVYTFVSLGNQEIVPELIRILDADGSVEIAETYLNCGESKLDQASRSWARQRGYQIIAGGRGGAASWGRW